MRNFPYCPRAKIDGSCNPLSNLLSTPDENGESSFFCVGNNRPDTRTVNQDRFTVCFKNKILDEETHWDKRDITDQLAVMMTALSVDENYKIANGLTDSDMEIIIPGEDINDQGTTPFLSPGIWKEDAIIEIFETKD